MVFFGLLDRVDLGEVTTLCFPSSQDNGGVGIDAKFTPVPLTKGRSTQHLLLTPAFPPDSNSIHRDNEQTDAGHLCRLHTFLAPGVKRSASYPVGGVLSLCPLNVAFNKRGNVGGKAWG